MESMTGDCNGQRNENSTLIDEGNLKKSSQKSCPKFKIWRFLFIVFAVMLLAFNSNSAMTVSSIQSIDLKDYYHECTTYFNKALSKDEGLRDLLLSISALLQDITLIYIVLLWIAKIENWKFPLSFITFFTVKIISSLIFSLKEPESTLWGSPYLSLTFTSSKSWNFFFSGLLGLNIICFIEIRKGSNSLIAKIISSCALINTIYQIILFGLLRSNYVIDLFTSLTIGHYSTYIGEALDHAVNSMFSLKVSENLIKQKEKEN